MKPMNEEEFLLQTRKLLDQQLRDIDAAIVTRLDAARERALSAAAPESARIVSDMRKHLDASLRAIDPHNLQRLDQIRQRALRQGVVRQISIFEQLTELLRNYRLAIPTGAVAAAFVLVTAISILYRTPGTMDELEFADELTLLASADDLELYENLDFYLWLADNGMPD